MRLPTLQHRRDCGRAFAFLALHRHNVYDSAGRLECFQITSPHYPELGSCLDPEAALWSYWTNDLTGYERRSTLRLLDSPTQPPGSDDQQVCPVASLLIIRAAVQRDKVRPSLGGAL
jgi:hypothetical protein